MFRVGDTYPHNMLEVHVRAYIYRWQARTTSEGDVLPYEVTTCWNAPGVAGDVCRNQATLFLEFHAVRTPHQKSIAMFRDQSRSHRRALFPEKCLAV